MTAPVNPAASGANAQSCWHLVYNNGVLVDCGDSIPHFDTEEEALREAGGFSCERLGRPAPQQLPTACFLVLARCGYVLDEEGAVQMHHETAEQAVQVAKDYGWILLPDGTYRCDADCDDCAEADQ